MASITQIQDLLTQYNLVDPKLVQDFLGLAGTRGASQNRPSNIMFENTEYFYCRNSSRYYELEYMVKDKDGKSKGYSSIGNSIYSLAQKHKKSMMATLSDTKDELIALDYKSKTFDKDNKLLREELGSIQQTIDNGLYADGAWMVENFLASLKPERIALFNKIAKTKEELS